MRAYEQAVERLPNDSRLLADYADVAAMAQGRRLQGKPEALIAPRARRRSAQRQGAVAGRQLAFEKGNYAGAVEWRRILPLVPPGSDAERSVRGSIAEAQRLAATASVAIEGRVELDAAPSPAA